MAYAWKFKNMQKNSNQLETILILPQGYSQHYFLSNAIDMKHEITPNNGFSLQVKKVN